MNDNIFIDTNVLLYAYSSTEPEKRDKVRELITNGRAFTSTKVLQELANILHERFKIDWEQISDVLAECMDNFEVYTNTDYTVAKACFIARDYEYSFYDSQVITTALQTNSSVLYSESMTNGQIIEDRLTIRDPFI
jgi:predicted nucleic acid-binding protein